MPLYLVSMLKQMFKQKIWLKERKLLLRYFSIIYDVIDEANKIIDGMGGENELIETLIGECSYKSKFFNFRILKSCWFIDWKVEK